MISEDHDRAGQENSFTFLGAIKIVKTGDLNLLLAFDVSLFKVKNCRLPNLQSHGSKIGDQPSFYSLTITNESLVSSAAFRDPEGFKRCWIVLQP